jgi:hypothetical protein
MGGVDMRLTRLSGIELTREEFVKVVRATAREYFKKMQMACSKPKPRPKPRPKPKPGGGY